MQESIIISYFFVKTGLNVFCDLADFLFSAKAQDLRKDIEILSQTFERIVDRKDAILKSLVKDLDEADEQYQVSLRSHIQSIDKLIGKHEVSATKL